MRMWMEFEIGFLFMWLGSIIVYLQFTFWTKATSFSKVEGQLKGDQNIWNDKNTEDYLRYLKKEAYDLCLQITMFATGLNFGFLPYYRNDND